MAGRLNYAWRLAVTGACFAVFGIGGIAVSVLVFPAMRLLPGTRHQRGLRVKWLISRFFASLVAVLQQCGVMRLETVGLDRLRQSGNVLVLANHPTYIDVVVLLALIPEATCVVKAALWRSPFFGGVVRAADYISNSTPEALVDDSVAALAEGAPLLIFPEGTRSRPGEPCRFLRGAAYVALKSGAPIMPVLLHCDPPTLTKNSKWYQIPPRAFRYRVEVRAPLPASTFAATAGTSPIAARRLTDALEHYFTRELEAYGTPAA